MGAGTPSGVFLLVTADASLQHREYVGGLEVNLIRHIAPQMRGDSPQIGPGGAPVAVSAVHFPMRGPLPGNQIRLYFMATGAPLAPSGLVVVIRRGNHQERT